jgi:hypothetical protein
MATRRSLSALCSCFLIIFCSNCGSIDPQLLRRNAPIPQKLPPLKLETDVQSLEFAFSEFRYGVSMRHHMEDPDFAAEFKGLQKKYVDSPRRLVLELKPRRPSVLLDIIYDEVVVPLPKESLELLEEIVAQTGPYYHERLLNRVKADPNLSASPHTRYSNDSRVAHSISIVRNELSKNICSEGKESMGTIRFRVTRARYSVGRIERLLTVATVTLINLAGYPWATQRVEFDVVVDILDKRRRIIGTYEGTGSATARAAYYYGYGISGSHSPNSDSKLSVGVSAEALVAAIEAIKRTVAADAVNLSARLMEVR